MVHDEDSRSNTPIVTTPSHTYGVSSIIDDWTAMLGALGRDAWSQSITDLKGGSGAHVLAGFPAGTDGTLGGSWNSFPTGSGSFRVHMLSTLVNSHTTAKSYVFSEDFAAGHTQYPSYVGYGAGDSTVPAKSHRYPFEAWDRTSMSTNEALLCFHLIGPQDQNTEHTSALQNEDIAAYITTLVGLSNPTTTTVVDTMDGWQQNGNGIVHQTAHVIPCSVDYSQYTNG
eukprot:gnl/MRDRNA2_/MRDRNA2_17962_c0_seq1.p1 gnl/MRDRNA2_/MRDRNA2_17962_c0~~gnl/MRDRNA2_/MRDRNA2_17962_c0_seq1.p1  ORF type:complete len:266 (+),score=22.77 gnl/MRDRNA2_/MRDRNA2_17962_c0_seq1:118-798(+)